MMWMSACVLLVRSMRLLLARAYGFLKSTSIFKWDITYDGTGVVLNLSKQIYYVLQWLYLKGVFWFGFSLRIITLSLGVS